MPAFGTRNRIIALIGENENRSLYNASEGLGGFFILSGYQHQIINLMAADGTAQLAAAMEEGNIAFAYGFAGVGSRLEDRNGVNLWTAFRVPFLSFWHDHPAHNYRQHITASPYLINCYHVLDHLLVWQKYLPHANSATLLHTPGGPSPYARTIPWAQRQKKFFYAKTAHRPELIAERWQQHSISMRDILWGLVEQAKLDRNLDLAEATDKMFQKTGYSKNDLDTFMGVIQEVDNYIRCWRSDRLARALLAYPTHIYGRGWDYLSGQSAKAEIFPAFPSGEMWNKSSSYRLFANSNPLWREGVHERVLIGIAGGSVLLTDRTDKSDRLFGDLPNYVGFDWTDDLDERISKAWDKAHDDADYVDLSEKTVIGLEYSYTNFTSPLEQSVIALLNRVADATGVKTA